MTTRYYLEDIEDLAKRFKWTKDGVDTFRILSNTTGPLEGDCDDFAVTALWLAEGRNMRWFWAAILTGRAVIWRALTDEGNGHAVLWHREHGYIENGVPRWRPKIAKDLTLVRKRWSAEIASKLLLGKVLR